MGRRALAGVVLLVGCGGTAPAAVPQAPLSNQVEPEPEPARAPEPEPEPEPEPPPPITGISYGATVADGTTFVIVALSPEDAFYEDSAKIVNLRCTASGPLTETGTGLYAGNAKCSDGEEYTFYQVSITTP